jgi:tripartite-type tricarboxylate transporter receptor subunit TctC
MNLPRRNFLHLAAGAAALPTASRIARAQAYPSRPVRCIVGYAPGGGTDIFVRLVGQTLPARLGQPFVIENRAGASSNIATEAVIRAPADGYTLLGTDSAAALNAALFDNLNFNFIRDMALVGVSRGPLVVAVHPSLPVKTIPEFITYAKANAGKIALGSRTDRTRSWNRPDEGPADDPRAVKVIEEQAEVVPSLPAPAAPKPAS